MKLLDVEILLVIAVIMLSALCSSVGYKFGRQSFNDRVEYLCNEHNAFVLRGKAYVCVPCEGCKDGK